MADGYVLTAKDRKKLQKLMADCGMSPAPYSPQDVLPGTPEVYVAKIQDIKVGTGTGTGTTEGSIPALIPKGDDDYDHPGCALCDIYHIAPSASLEDWDLRPIANFTRPVFNLTSVDIGDEWLLAVRDKQGQWIACKSGSEVSYFQLLTDIGCDAYMAIANPGELNPNTFVRDDPYDGVIDPEYSVVVAASGQRMGAWIGDWVEAVSTGETIEIDGYEDEFPVYEVTTRLSAQATYKGALLAELSYGVEGSGTAAAELSINGSTRTILYSLVYLTEIWQVTENTLYAWDWLLQEGESIPNGTVIFVTYLADAGKFYVTDTPCAAGYVIM